MIGGDLTYILIYIIGDLFLCKIEVWFEFFCQIIHHGINDGILSGSIFSFSHNRLQSAGILKHSVHTIFIPQFNEGTFKDMRNSGFFGKIPQILLSEISLII